MRLVLKSALYAYVTAVCHHLLSVKHLFTLELSIEQYQLQTHMELNISKKRYICVYKEAKDIPDWPFEQP